MIVKHESDFMEGIRKHLFNFLTGLSRQVPPNKHDLAVIYTMTAFVTVFSIEVLPSCSLGYKFHLLQ